MRILLLSTVIASALCVRVQDVADIRHVGDEAVASSNSLVRNVVSDALDELSKAVAQLNRIARDTIATANKTVVVVKQTALNATNTVVSNIAKDVTSAIIVTGSQVSDFITCVNVPNLLLNVTNTLARKGDECATRSLAGLTRSINELLDIVSEAERILERGRNATILCSDLDFICFGLNLLPLPHQARALAARASRVVADIRRFDANVLIRETATCISLSTATYAAESTLVLIQHVFNCIANNPVGRK